jgi:hypothetical protein
MYTCTVVLVTTTDPGKNARTLVLAHQPPVPPTTRSASATSGHLPALQWVRDNERDWDIYTCACAGENGHLPFIQWARENGCPRDFSSYLAAERWGYYTQMCLIMQLLKSFCEKRLGDSPIIMHNVYL